MKNVNVQKKYKNLQMDLMLPVSWNLPPLTWVVNYRNGTSISSKQQPEFLDLPEKENIVAMRILVGENKYTVTKKVNKDYLAGFFYHIKAGYKAIIGSMHANFEYTEERIGFCYNQLGDAVCIRFSHGGYLQEVTRRIKAVQKLLHVPISFKETDENMEVIREKARNILDKPLSYKLNVEFYQENLFEKRVAISRFGNIDDPNLPVGTVFPLPRVYENTKEVTVEFGKTN